MPDFIKLNTFVAYRSWPQMTLSLQLPPGIERSLVQLPINAPHAPIFRLDQSEPPQMSSRHGPSSRSPGTTAACTRTLLTFARLMRTATSTMGGHVAIRRLHLLPSTQATPSARIDAAALNKADGPTLMQTATTDTLYMWHLCCYPWREFIPLQYVGMTHATIKRPHQVYKSYAGLPIFVFSLGRFVNAGSSQDFRPATRSCIPRAQQFSEPQGSSQP